MAYLAVDKDGTEAIYEDKPFRQGGCWRLYYEEDYVVLPKGTIKKLIGRELTWEDDAVALT